MREWDTDTGREWESLELKRMGNAKQESMGRVDFRRMGRENKREWNCVELKRKEYIEQERMGN